MISVLLYGRNDAHGYNLHRRAALSLNCIAELLTDPDDELIFVDYNTPDELPTFIEAISDTLTDRCLARLRVLRVPAAIHEQRFASLTHLPVAEPVARNVAARRANPANRWLLSTNTDMVFVPLQGLSMSELCHDLPDGFYGLPRFELPEWLWEGLPRSDPRGALAQIGRLGPNLRLDEPTTSHEWIRFDAPGDCQLMLREDFISIDGFNEDMLLGYHVDSNLSRRMLLHRGSIDSLEGHLAGYHCNHNRTRTLYHGTAVQNDVQKFYYAVDQSALTTQRTSWGLAHVDVEEVPLRGHVGADTAATFIGVMPSRPRSSSDALDAPFSLTYDSGHVLPFIADSLLLSRRDVTVGYIGANRVLEGMLAASVAGLGFTRPLLAAGFDDTIAIDRAAATADVFIVDLGVDVSEAGGSLDPSQRELELPPGLRHALSALHRLFELERSRYARVKHLRPFVLVNSLAIFCDAFVLAQLDCSYTTPHSRVRRATVKPLLDPDTLTQLARAERLLRWYERRSTGATIVPVAVGQTVDVRELDDYSGFREGWSMPEDTGIWTEGSRAQLRIGLDGSQASEEVLTLGLAMVCVDPDEPLRVSLLANGELVGARYLREFDYKATWHVPLPSSAAPAGTTDLTLLIDEPRSPLARGWSSDPRELGIHLRTLSLGEAHHSVRLGESVVFSDGSGAERLLGDGWSYLEPTGVWTVGEHARLILELTDTEPTDVDVVLEVAPFLTDDHRELEVTVSAREQRVGGHVFRHGEQHPILRFRLPGVLMDPEGRAVLDIRLREPASPFELGMSEDRRRLGLLLRSLTIGEPIGKV